MSPARCCVSWPSGFQCFLPFSLLAAGGAYLSYSQNPNALGIGLSQQTGMYDDSLPMPVPVCSETYGSPAKVL